MPEVETPAADTDAFDVAAKYLAERERAVSAAAESPPADPIAAAVVAEATGAPKAVVGATEAESGGEAAPATEAPAKDVTGTEEDAVVKSLRAAIAADPALALVPDIRARVGLPAIGQTNGHDTTKAAKPNRVEFKGVPTEEEILKAAQPAYEEKMKANDDFGAVYGTARAVSEAQRPAIVQEVLQILVQRAEQGERIEAFKQRHPNFAEHRDAMRAKYAELATRGLDTNLIDPEEVWGMVVRPGPAPKSVADAAAEALKVAAAPKKAAAASAAAAPTNLRAPGIPAPKKEPSPAERAMANVFGPITKESRESRSLYPAEAIAKRR